MSKFSWVLVGLSSGLLWPVVLGGFWPITAQDRVVVGGLTAVLAAGIEIGRLSRQTSEEKVDPEVRAWFRDQESRSMAERKLRQ